MRVCLGFLFIVIASVGNAQGFKIRHSMVESAKKDKPASLNLNFPEDESDFINVNIATGIGSDKLSGFAEWHYNNQLKKDQNNVKFGLTNNLSGSIINVQHGLNYNNDIIKDIESAQYTAYIFPVPTRNTFLKFNTWLPKKKSPDDVNDVSFLLKPTLALHEDYRYRAETDSLEGNVFHYGFKIDLEVEIVKDPKNDESDSKDLPYPFVGILFQEQGFWNSNDTEQDLSDFINFFKFSIYYNLSKDADAKNRLAVEYVNGGNPIDGLERQQYWQLTFQFKR